MVYSVLSVVLRRNLTKVTVQQLKHKNLLSPVVSIKPLVCSYSTDSPYKAKVSSVVSKALSGKISISELSELNSAVIRESQFKRVTESPKPFLYLGLAGLVPFTFVPLATIINGTALDGLVFAQLAYGATILSFLGGINYGTAVANGTATTQTIALASAPQLVGWVALTLPTPVGLVLTSVGLYSSLVHDVLLTSYPTWFKALRFVLTAGAIGSLATTLALSTVY